MLAFFSFPTIRYSGRIQFEGFLAQVWKRNSANRSICERAYPAEFQMRASVDSVHILIRKQKILSGFRLVRNVRSSIKFRVLLISRGDCTGPLLNFKWLVECIQLFESHLTISEILVDQVRPIHRFDFDLRTKKTGFGLASITESYRYLNPRVYVIRINFGDRRERC